MIGQLDIQKLEALGNCRVARIFDAAAVAWPGAVLVVPLSMLGGDLDRLVHETPCPVADILDTMQRPRPLPMAEAKHGIWPGPGSQFDVVDKLIHETGHPGGWWVCTSESVGKRIFTHDCGVRLGLVNDLVDKGPL